MAKKGIATIKTLYQQEGISKNQLAPVPTDKMIIDEGTEYVIRNGVIGPNWEWHYLGQKDPKKVKKGIFKDRRNPFKVQRGTRFGGIQKNYSGITHTPRKLMGPVTGQFHDFTPEINEIQLF